MNDKCKLCGNFTTEIRKSHFIPKSIYSKLESMVNKKDGYVIMFSTEGTNMPLAKHITAHHLCDKCEDLFSKNGEKFFIENGFSKVNLKNRTEFISDKEYDSYIEKYITENKPILVQKFTDSIFVSQKDKYISNLLSIDDSKKLLYFAISIFWRSSLDWSKYSSPRFDNFVLDEMRNYLLGNIDKVSYFRLKVDFVTREIYAAIFPFSLKKEEGKNIKYIFYIPNFIFTLEVLNNGCEQNIENVITYGRNKEMSDLCYKKAEEAYHNSENKGKKPHSLSWLQAKSSKP